MKIRTTITRSEVVEKEVAIPYFCKNEKGDYFAVFSEDSGNMNGICISNTGNLIHSFRTRFSMTSIADANQVSEEEFRNAFEKCLQGILSIQSLSEVAA